MGGLLLMLMISSGGFWTVLAYISMLFLPSLILLVWFGKRKKFLLGWGCCVLAFFVALGVNFGIIKYNENITIDVDPNINVQDYLPFVEKSKIVKLDSKTLKLEGDLPIVDGAAAVFPVYSAFVNATYPSHTKLVDGVFLYNNTSVGYKQLAERKTDIFFGAYPSEEQIEYAESCGTTFEYTKIGSEAFVFFVHKNNPIESLTTEQIKGIYSGEITNWSEVGGRNEEIVAFQRNNGSGSQSMLKRFMGETPIMDAPTEQVNGFMSGIIEQVSDYKNKSSSIGFSFRYYVEGIVKNPDIKLIAVDGVAPTVENIKNGSYPIITSLYAVSYKGNTNKNVNKLIEWILSAEGQYIIEQTGYVGIE